MDWQRLITDVGVVAGIALFFVWTSWQRENRLAARISELEHFVERELFELVRDTSTALRSNTEQMVQLIEALSGRPCLVESMREGKHSHS